MRNYIMEFIGTMFLVLAVGLSGNPIAIGVMLMVMVYMGGHISGGHYNPAVTLSIWMRGKIATNQVAGYMIFQILGAFVAAVIYYLLKSHTFAPASGGGETAGKAILVEILFTFILCSVVLTTATTERLKGNYIYGLAIGFTLMTGIYSGGPISGGVYNPAVVMGPILMDLFKGGSEVRLLYIYLIGPLAGGALAALVYRYLNPEEFK